MFCDLTHGNYGKPTLRVSFSNKGPSSADALLGCDPGEDFFLNAAVLLSSSDRIFVQDSSIRPVEILVTTSGDTLSSSTSGPKAFSTSLRFCSRRFSADERSCNDSISADTAARSFRKLARFFSTEFRTSSQAVIDRRRLSNVVRSF